MDKDLSTVSSGIPYTSHCRVWWIDGVLLASLALIVGLHGLESMHRGVPSWIWVAMAATVVLLIVLIGGVRLTIDAERVRVRWGWLRIPCWSMRRVDIVGAETAKVRPLWDYGGWGIRYGSGQGWGFILHGRCVRLLTRRNKRVTVSVDCPEEVVKLLCEPDEGIKRV